MNSLHLALPVDHVPLADDPTTNRDPVAHLDGLDRPMILVNKPLATIDHDSDNLAANATHAATDLKATPLEVNVRPTAIVHAVTATKVIALAVMDHAANASHVATDLKAAPLEVNVLPMAIVHAVTATKVMDHAVIATLVAIDPPMEIGQDAMMIVRRTTVAMTADAIRQDAMIDPTKSPSPEKVGLEADLDPLVDRDLEEDHDPLVDHVLVADHVLVVDHVLEVDHALLAVDHPAVAANPNDHAENANFRSVRSLPPPRFRPLVRKRDFVPSSFTPTQALACSA